MAQFEVFSVLSLLEKGGFVVHHIEDGWHIYPGGLTIDEGSIRALEAEGYLKTEQTDSETTKFYLAPAGAEELADIKTLTMEKA